jgi:lipopolysaccharide/colanic/teichoic acid biosynthesis glycosyltransferase
MPQFVNVLNGDMSLLTAASSLSQNKTHAGKRLKNDASLCENLGLLVWLK